GSHEKNNCIHQKSLNIVTIPEMLMSEKTPLFRGFLAHFSSDYCQSPDIRTAAKAQEAGCVLFFFLLALLPCLG
ncbi:MAG: hypothetical protein IJI13_06660, partial [Oscillospiraceae bacterium]|nr:hypothetical protein [Oscillospiraceae bacterium]